MQSTYAFVEKDEPAFTTKSLMCAIGHAIEHHVKEVDVGYVMNYDGGEVDDQIPDSRKDREVLKNLFDILKNDYGFVGDRRFEIDLENLKEIDREGEN